MKKTLLLSALCVMVFLFAAAPVHAATFPVTCSGSGDQSKINSALQSAAGSPGSIVHINPGRCVVSASIVINGSVTLEGESGTVLTFAESFWPRGSSNEAMIMNNSGSSNTVIIRGFEIDGAYNNNNRGDSSKDLGDGRRNFIFSSSSKLELANMYWHNSPGDGVKVKSSSSVNIHDLKIDTLGHDAIVLQSCSGGDVSHNDIRTRGNAGVRLFGSSFIKIHDNYIYAVEGEFFSPGGPGLELQRGVKGDDLHDIEVYNNFLYHTWQSGIQLVAFDGPAYTRDQVKNVYIHHNLIVNCGWHGSYDWMAGVVLSGVYNVVIESNTLDGNYGGGIVYLESLGLQSNGTSGKYDVHVRNNIVTNSVRRGGNKSGSPGAGDASQSGQGIINYNTAEGNMILENNLVFGNVGGSYKNVSSASDISADPLFANRANRDYHLKSRAGRWDPAASSWVTDAVSSPAIDAGLPSSAFANEPQSNGGRINLGRYGNTSQASLSGAGPQAVMPPAPAEEDFVGDFIGSNGGTTTAPPKDSDAEFTGGTGAGDYQANLTQGAAGGATEVTGLYRPPVDLPSTAVTACRVDETANNSAGLIPCGRSANDPATPWNECSPCTLFSMILMGQLAIEFLVKMAAITSVLAIIAGGLLYVFAAGREQLITQAKSMITAVLTGFTVILIAWVIIDAILSSLGYINPLGGEWYALENPQATAVTTAE